MKERAAFNDGKAPVLVNGKWGYIDKSGKFAINPQFDEAGMYSDGMALIRIGDHVMDTSTRAAKLRSILSLKAPGISVMVWR